MNTVHNLGHNQYQTGGLVRRCKCNCRFNRNNNPLRLPFVNNLYSVIDPEVTIPLVKLDVNVDMEEGVSLTYLKQVYHNTSKDIVECIYKFPSNDSYIVSGLEVKVGDKTIEAEIMEKVVSDQKYDDAVAAGNTAVQMKCNDDDQDVIDINVGNILPNQEVEVTVKFIFKLESVSNSASYSYIFPMELIPGVRKYINMTKLDENIVAKFDWDFNMSVNLSSHSKISNINCSHEFETKFSDDQKSAKLIFVSKSQSIDSDIIVSYSTDEIREPIITLHSDPNKYEGEVAAHISFVPRLSEEIKVAEPTEETKSDQKNWVEEDQAHASSDLDLPQPSFSDQI